MHYFLVPFVVCLFLNCHLYGLADRYQLIDIGVLEYESSEVTGINNKSELCGSYTTRFSEYAFVWSKYEGSNHLYFSAPERLNLISPVKLFITNSSIVYGTYIQWLPCDFWGFNGAEHEMLYKWENPFSYFTGINTTHLGNPVCTKERLCSPSTFPLWDVNDRNQLLIMDTRVLDQSAEHGIWVYDNSTFKQIANPYLNAATRINNHSQIMGYSNSLHKTVIYDLNEDQITFFNINEETKGEDLNDLGQVAGVIKESNGNLTGFFGTPDEYVQIPNFLPCALNNCGQLIGYTANRSPAIWELGQLTLMSDLMTLIDDKGNEWDHIEKLTAINDLGEIVGQGFYNGKPHGFLLIPVTGSP